MNHLEFKEDILSVPIWGMQITDENSSFNQELINFSYWLKDNTGGKQRSNKLGWQSTDSLFQEYADFLKPLIEPISTLCNDIVKDHSERIKAPVLVDSMWLNINPQYSYNAHHVHSGTLSGVYWISIPENSGRLVLVNPAGRSEASRIRVKNYGLTPTPGACIIFPSWLEHYVEPNENTKDRLSISFNISEGTL